MPCLSSRIPYGTAVTVDLLGRLDRAELAVRALGFGDVRVRHHDDTARVEVPVGDLGRRRRASRRDRRRAAGARLPLRHPGSGRAAVGQPQRRAGEQPAGRTRHADDRAGHRAAGRRPRPQPSRPGPAPTRIGLPEAVFAAGKTPEQCVEIVERMLADTDDPVIVTRCAAEHRAALADLAPHGTWSVDADVAPRAGRGSATVAVVSGGTSDEPVVHECVGTLTAMGAPVRVVPRRRGRRAAPPARVARRARRMSAPSSPSPAWRPRCRPCWQGWSPHRSSPCRPRSATAPRSTGSPRCCR